jgi:hypothetical protein
LAFAHGGGERRSLGSTAAWPLSLRSSHSHAVRRISPETLCLCTDDGQHQQGHREQSGLCGRCDGASETLCTRGASRDATRRCNAARHAAWWRSHATSELPRRWGLGRGKSAGRCTESGQDGLRFERLQRTFECQADRPCADQVERIHGLSKRQRRARCKSTRARQRFSWSNPQSGRLTLGNQ